MSAAQKPCFILEPQELQDLRDRIANQLEQVVVATLGEPKFRGKREWRWGSRNGSLCIVMTGDKRGLWTDRATNEGGDALALIGGSGTHFSATLERACHLVGYHPPSHDLVLTDEQRRARAAMLDKDRICIAADLAARRAKAAAKDKADDTAAILVARQKATASVPPHNTPAETYLTTRGITLEQWPPGLSFYRDETALLAVGTTKQGLITCCQIVRLTTSGQKRLNGRLVKQTYGRVITEHGRSAFRLPAISDPSILCHAEGIETGLSAWAGTGAETWVGLGAGVDPQFGRLNVILVDDDAPDSDRARYLVQQCQSWDEAGIWYVLATPWEIPRGDGSDFNDLIRGAGKEAVRNRIQHALTTRSRPPTVPPTVPMPTVAPTISTAQLRDVVGLPILSWVQQATVRADERLAAQKTAAQRKSNPAYQGDRNYQGNIPPGQQAVAMSGVGSGKTDHVLHAAAEALCIPALPGNPPRRAIVHVQDHALAGDIIKRATKILPPEIPIQVYLGYNQPDPNAPGFADPSVPVEQKTKQCVRAKEMDAVTKAGGSMAILCGCPAKGFCEFNAKNPAVESPCGYTTTQTIESGLLIMAGPQTLKQGAPGSFKRTVNYFNPDTRRTNKVSVDVADFVVIDEPKTIALIGPSKEDGSAYDLTVGDLTAPLTMFAGKPDTMTDEEVRQASDMVSQAVTKLDAFLANLTSGPLTRTACLQINAMTNWADVRRHDFEFKVAMEDYIHPSMRGDRLKEALARLSQHNGRIMQIDRLCRSLIEAAEAIRNAPDDAVSGLVELRQIPGHGDRPPARVLLLRWIVPVHKDWMGPPTLQLDAEAKPEVMRKWWPGLEVLTTARLPTPNAVYRRQVYNSSFPYMSYAPKDPTNPPILGERITEKAENTKWNNCRWLVQFLTDKLNRYHNQATDGDYDVLVIAPQRTEEALRALWEQIGGVPARIGIIHFQNFAGLNEYANVRYLCIIGRPQPRPEIFEALAWVINGIRGVSVAEEMLPVVEGVYMMRDGTARLAKVRQHPDPMAELIRTILVDNQLIQGEGRGRGIWRTEANPLFIDHLCDIPLPLLVDELITLNQLKQEGSTARWLMASGVCPVPDERGCLPFLAAVTGTTLRAMEIRVEREPRWLDMFRHPTTMPVFQVKLADQRYATPMAINATSIDEATARLVLVGIKNATVNLPEPPSRPDGTIAHLMADHGLILFSPAHAAVWYPEFFNPRADGTANVESAKKRLNRAGIVADQFGDKSPLNPLILHSKRIDLIRRLRGLRPQMSPNWIGVNYRLTGVGRQGAFALVEASRMETIRAEMEATLGTLEVFNVIQTEPKPEQPDQTLTFPPTRIPTHKRPQWHPPAALSTPPGMTIATAPWTAHSPATGPP